MSLFHVIGCTNIQCKCIYNCNIFFCFLKLCVCMYSVSVVTKVNSSHLVGHTGTTVLTWKLQVIVICWYVQAFFFLLNMQQSIKYFSSVPASDHELLQFVLVTEGFYFWVNFKSWLSVAWFQRSKHIDPCSPHFKGFCWEGLGYSYRFAFVSKRTEFTWESNDSWD